LVNFLSPLPSLKALGCFSVIKNTISKTFRKLIVWQEGKKLVLLVYCLTKIFPPEEKFAMVTQMRRTAYSFLVNIAEGNSRNSIKDKLRFFNIAQASIVELDCFSELAFELKYVNDDNYQELLDEINKCSFLLQKLISSQK
jgi:four helix bundle protein